MPIRACLDCGSDRLVFPKAGTTTFTEGFVRLLGEIAMRREASQS